MKRASTIAWERIQANSIAWICAELINLPTFCPHTCPMGSPPECYTRVGAYEILYITSAHINLKAKEMSYLDILAPNEMGNAFMS